MKFIIEIKAIASDCFGTIFDMSSMPTEETTRYAKHVKSRDFSPFDFGDEWYKLRVHEDVPHAFAFLRAMGLSVFAFSNGSKELIEKLAINNNISFDGIIDPSQYKCYKPTFAAYDLVYYKTGIPANQIAMVSANPGFGDMEGSARTGMWPFIIRRDEGLTYLDFARYLETYKV